jgi:hypothetical protein
MRKILVILTLAAGMSLGCAPIRSYEVVQQPVATTLHAGIGGKLFRLERTSDLPTASGGADIFGGKVDRGFVELRFVGLADDGRVILRLTDVETRSNETTMSRYGVGHATATRTTTATGYGSWTTASGEYIPPPKGQTVVLPPNTVEFWYDTTTGPLVIEGMEGTFQGVSPQVVTYRLQDLRPSRNRK